MRLGWSIPLPGPFWLSGTLWRSRPRRRRTRWQHPLYWLTGLAFMELSLWLTWTCLWLAGRGCLLAWRAVRRRR